MRCREVNRAEFKNNIKLKKESNITNSKIQTLKDEKTLLNSFAVCSNSIFFAGMNLKKSAPVSFKGEIVKVIPDDWRFCY